MIVFDCLLDVSGNNTIIY